MQCNTSLTVETLYRSQRAISIAVHLIRGPASVLSREEEMDLVMKEERKKAEQSRRKQNKAEAKF